MHGTPFTFSRITAYETTSIIEKNEDKIDESHKSQLKFKYEIFIKLHDKNKNLKTYIGLLRFWGPRFFKTHFYSPVWAIRRRKNIAEMFKSLALCPVPRVQQRYRRQTDDSYGRLMP